MSTEMEKTKQCKTCMKHMTYDNYYKSKVGYYGSKCKICAKIYNRTYNNKAINKARITLPHRCMCGGSYTINHKKQHLKTKRHLKYVESGTPDTSLISCVCGGLYKDTSEYLHMKTNKHTTYMNNYKN